MSVLSSVSLNVGAVKIETPSYEEEHFKETDDFGVVNHFFD